MREILVFLKHVPEKYKSGPWCWAAYLYILSYCYALVHYHDQVDFNEPEFSFDKIPEWIPYVRLACAVYCIIITVVVVCAAGPLPLTTYTITSWNLLTIRLMTSFLGDMGYEWAFNISQLTLFPSLVGCSITCTIWWLVLTPLISNILHKKKKDHAEFWKWNTSFVLINLHGLMLVFAAADYIYCGRHLVFCDLWMGFAVAFVYVVFYLLVLDPQGLHFYIILTPRTPLCVISYSFILLVYYGSYLGWNQVARNLIDDV
mmetsp:Transcript_2710/g.4923  ORF Transcript_2710/g.4923 Transcript_2710/m.4923 type:complete len:259 (-) Transcript_2710:1244-2020(-)